MEVREKLVLFRLDARTYALRLEAVRRVVAVVEVEPLPSAPPVVLGVVDVEGAVRPVFDLRRRFRLPAKPAELSDQLILAATARGEAALVVDAVAGVIEVPEAEIARPERISSGLAYVEGVATRPEGLVVIHNLDTFLSGSEAETLASALTTRTGPV